MKRNVILSTVAATVVTGVLMMSGCGKTSPVVYIPQASDATAVGNGTVANGSSSTTNVENSAGKFAASVTMENATDDSGNAANGSYSAERNCYKDANKPLEVSQHNDACVRATAFAELDSDNYTPAAGTSLRFSGVLDLVSDNVASANLTITLAHPPCATDRDGTIHYVNFKDRPDTRKLRILITPIPTTCGDTAGTARWVTVEIETSTGPGNSVPVVDRKVLLDMLGLTDLPVRLTIFSEQATDAETIAEDDADGTGDESGATGSTGSTGSTGGLGG